MRKILATVAAIVASGLIAYGASLPLVPSTQPYNEASAIVSTLNALIQQLNGVQGYAPSQVVSLGSAGTASGATPVTLAAQRGVVSFTGVGTLVTGAVTTLTMTNSLITASSQCFAQVQSGGAAGSGPYISTATPTTGSLAMILANGGTTATGAAATFAIAFTCS
jgi:outer membrane murein-binding lipoprotein Lpp